MALFLGLGVLGVRALWSACIDSAYHRVGQLEVLVIIKKESDDNPHQGCVATDLGNDYIDGFDCPDTVTKGTILIILKDKSLTHRRILFVVHFGF